MLLLHGVLFANDRWMQSPAVAFFYFGYLVFFWLYEVVAISTLSFYCIIDVVLALNGEGQVFR